MTQFTALSKDIISRARRLERDPPPRSHHRRVRLSFHRHRRDPLPPDAGAAELAGARLPENTQIRHSCPINPNPKGYLKACTSCFR